MSEDIKKFLEDFDNRKKYTSPDAETLKGIKDEELERAILDYVLYKIGSDYRREYEIVTGLPKGYRVIFTTMEAEGEVYNGGFKQYFWNTLGQFAFEAADGFREIGAPKAAELMDRAIAMAAEEFPEMKKYQEEGTAEAFIDRTSTRG